MLLAPLVGVAARSRRAVGTARRTEQRSPRLTAAQPRRSRWSRSRTPVERELGTWIVVDPAGGLLVGVIGVVGLASVLVSPRLPRRAHTDRSFRAERADRIYCGDTVRVLGVLLAVPLAGNLGAAWLSIEATTAASALLVGFSGRPERSRPAGNTSILTSLGLGVALLGILILEAAAGGGGLERADLARAASRFARSKDDGRRLRAPARRTRGQGRLGAGPQLAARCPLRSPPPQSRRSCRLLSSPPCCSSPGARSRHSPRQSESEPAGGVLVGFGLVSLAVAVPFLWRPQAWKRLLAYSSLEHMGVIALGIGFGGPLALAGVAIHIVGHAFAKALGFYAATPLLAHDTRAAGHAVAGIGKTQPALGASLGISLGALAGLPPSPLFVSEVLIVAGGFQVGRPWAASTAAILLALGFLGLAHALIDTVIGRPRGRDRHPALGLRSVVDADRHRRATASRAHCRRTVAARLRDRPRPRTRTRMSSQPKSGAAYRETVAAALADGWRFAGLHATNDAGLPVVRTLLASNPGELQLETVDAADGVVPTIVDLAPAAGWDEREAHDLYGVRFEGHEPLRPLIDHEGPIDRFTTPVRGPDPYQVAVGPIHAGVIESGHFRFHVVGDLILHVDARLFYKHRGLERAAEGLPLADGLPVVARACAGCWVTNAVAYAHACEEASVSSPPRSSRGHERSCSNSNGSGTPSTTSRQSVPASASRQAQAASQRSSTMPGN